MIRVSIERFLRGRGWGGEERSKKRDAYMVGHLFQNYDTIFVRFFATYTCDLSCFLLCVFFSPKYVAIFFSYVRSTQTYT